MVIANFVAKFKRPHVIFISVFIIIKIIKTISALVPKDLYPNSSNYSRHTLEVFQKFLGVYNTIIFANFDAKFKIIQLKKVFCIVFF